jgi:hypothetical protein
MQPNCFMLPFFQVGCACDVGFGLNVTLLARNRLIGRR